MKPVVIWGTSGHARVVVDAVDLAGELEIVGFLDDFREPGGEFLGRPVLGGQTALKVLAERQVRCLFVAVGDCHERVRLAGIAARQGFVLPTIVHPAATVARDARIGAGAFIAAGSVINSNAELGDYVIVNTSGTVSHDVKLGPGVHISPGAHLGGYVKVGEETWIGIGAVVKDRVCIGRRTIVGAGAVVLRDLPEGILAWGVPARIQRRREDHEKV